MPTFSCLNFVIIISVLPLLIKVEGEITFNILHTNNLAAEFEEEDGKYGIPRIIGFVKQEKESDTPTMYLDGADFFGGSPYIAIYKEKIVSDFVNIMNIDAMSLGCTEFFASKKTYLGYYKAVQVPILCANCNFSGMPDMKAIVKASIIWKQGSVQVGIVGYMRQELRYPVPEKDGLVMLDEVTSVQNEVNKLTEQGINIIIVLGHGDDDLNRKVAKEVDGIDVVVCGHDISFIYNGQSPVAGLRPVGSYPIRIKNKGGYSVPIVHSTEGTKFVGKLTVVFNETGNLIDSFGNLEYMDSSIQVDSAAQEKLQQFKKKVDEKKAVILGKSRVTLSGDNCTKLECSLGNLIADAYVHYKMSKYSHNYFWTDTAIGMYEGIMIKGKIVPQETSGNITFADIMGIGALREEAVTLLLNGTGLKQVIEHAVHFDEPTSGRFMQYSGVHVTIDKNNPPYSRITSLRVRCAKCNIPVYEEVDNDRYYRVIVNRFLGEGNLGFTTFAEAFDRKTEPLVTVDFVEEFIMKHSVIQTGIEQRIIIIQPRETRKTNNANPFCVNDTLIICIAAFWYTVHVTKYILYYSYIYIYSVLIRFIFIKNFFIT